MYGVAAPTKAKKNNPVTYVLCDFHANLIISLLIEKVEPSAVIFVISKVFFIWSIVEYVFYQEMKYLS